MCWSPSQVMHLYLVSHYICISFAHFSVLFMDPNIHCVDTSWALLDDTYKVLETMICHSCSNTAELTDHFLKLHVSTKNEAIWMLSEVVTYSDLYNWYWEQSLQPWKNVKACKIAVRIPLLIIQWVDIISLKMHFLVTRCIKKGRQHIWFTHFEVFS